MPPKKAVKKEKPKYPDKLCCQSCGSWWSWDSTREPPEVTECFRCYRVNGLSSCYTCGSITVVTRNWERDINYCPHHQKVGSEEERARLWKRWEMFLKKPLKLKCQCNNCQMLQAR